MIYAEYFALIINNNESIRHLEILSNSLSDSHPEKIIFLSLATLARTRISLRSINDYRWLTDTAHTMRQDLLELLRLGMSVSCFQI